MDKRAETFGKESEDLWTRDSRLLDNKIGTFGQDSSTELYYQKYQPPTPAVPSEISNCLKPQKMAEIKEIKLFSFFFGVTLQLCESHKIVLLLV